MCDYCNGHQIIYVCACVCVSRSIYKLWKFDGLYWTERENFAIIKCLASKSKRP